MCYNLMIQYNRNKDVEGGGFPRCLHMNIVMINVITIITIIHINSIIIIINIMTAIIVHRPI